VSAVAVVPITTRINPPVDSIGDKALERARRDFQETVRNNANGIEMRTQADAGGGHDQRRRDTLPETEAGIGARIAPADPRDLARSQASRAELARRTRGAPVARNPAPEAPAAPIGTPPRRLDVDPIGPPIPRELLPQLPTPPAGSSLVAEGLSGRSALVHRAVEGGAERMGGADAVTGSARRGGADTGPQYRLNTTTPPEIASRIAAFMRTGRLDRSAFAVTPVPGLIPEDRKPAPSPASSAVTPAAQAPAAALAAPVDLLPGFDRRKLDVIPTLPIPMQAQTIAMMPAGQFAPARAADLESVAAALTQEILEEDDLRRREEHQRIDQDAAEANPFFADGDAAAEPDRQTSGYAHMPVNPLFDR
jgi:hypothetical protein